MMILKKLLPVMAMLCANHCLAWEAEVTNVLQHGDYVAVYLNPDPGIGKCAAGQPYLLRADGTPGNEQKFSMLLVAMTTGRKISGYADSCSTAIWGVSRPTIERLHLSKA